MADVGGGEKSIPAWKIYIFLEYGRLDSIQGSYLFQESSFSPNPSKDTEYIKFL
jgi:hypothetical protein